MSEFERGYVCAVATMLAQHDDTVAAKDALNACGGIDWSRIGEYDKKVLMDAGLRLADFSSKRKSPGNDGAREDNGNG